MVFSIIWLMFLSLCLGFGLGFSLGEIHLINMVRRQRRIEDARKKLKVVAYIPRNEDERL